MTWLTMRWQGRLPNPSKTLKRDDINSAEKPCKIRLVVSPREPQRVIEITSTPGVVAAQWILG